MGKFYGAAAAALLAALGAACAATPAADQKITVIDNGRIDRWDPAMDASSTRMPAHEIFFMDPPTDCSPSYLRL